VRKLVIGLALLALTACGGSPRPRFADGVIDRALAGAPGMAQPSTIVAAELGFARMAQEKGQWTAFAEYAADDALMFVPQMVNAKDWLKQQKDPPQSVAWQPHQVWMSCDGSMAVTKGAWQRGDRAGYFTTVWQRQANREYKWVMDQGDVLAQPLAEPDFIQTQIADCGSKAVVPKNAMPIDTTVKNFVSVDQSLVWTVEVWPNCSRQLAGFMASREGTMRFEQLSASDPQGATCTRLQ